MFEKFWNSKCLLWRCQPRIVGTMFCLFFELKVSSSSMKVLTPKNQCIVDFLTDKQSVNPLLRCQLDLEVRFFPAQGVEPCIKAYTTFPRFTQQYKMSTCHRKGVDYMIWSCQEFLFKPGRCRSLIRCCQPPNLQIWAGTLNFKRLFLHLMHLNKTTLNVYNSLRNHKGGQYSQEDKNNLQSFKLSKIQVKILRISLVLLIYCSSWL